MASPASLVRLEELDANLDASGKTAASQEQIDVAHGTTGWSAYEVWRNRILAPQPKGYKKPHGNP